ncbi:MAG: glycosyltransferase 87 family protein [Acidimicrobiales bacterium]
MTAPLSAPITPGTDRTAPAGARWSLPSLVHLLWLVGACSAVAATWHAVHLATDALQLDLAVYLLGAHHLADGQLYVASLPTAPHLPFTYPPFAALGFTPLTLVSERTAQVVWSLVNVASVFAMLWLTLRMVRPSLDRRRRMLWALLLMAPAVWMEPVSLTLSFGQVNLVLAVLVLADLTATLRVGRFTLPGGVLVGVAAAVKLTPLIFIPYLLLVRRFREAWTAIGTFAGCAALMTVIDPRVSWSYWTKYATDVARIGGVCYISNQSLRAVADRLDHRLIAGLPITAASGVVLVAGVLLAAWAYRVSSPFLGLLVCATTGLIVSPITWAHHMVWIVPVLIWLVWAADRPTGGRIWALAAAALFWWAPIWTVPNGDNRELSEHGWQLVRGNSFFAAMVVFMVGVTVMLVMRRRRKSPRSENDQLVGAEHPGLARGGAERVR